MTKKPKPPKPESGGSQLYKRGKRPVQIAVTPEQLEQLKAAAAADSRSLTNFVTLAALEAARVMLEKRQER